MSDHWYTVVSGPPCSGKSTYIAERVAAGDVVVDFDRLGQAIAPGCDPYDYPEHVRQIVRAVRRATVQSFLHLRPAGATLWVIDTALGGRRTLAPYVAQGARVVELDPGEATCLERAGRERPPHVREIIEAWYRFRGRGA